ncbi:alpha-L-rhamnosidase [Polaribacter aestuariivivens]|uniref:alpha-L-rhamnosidase n=1 Tax=Polaribacter aestuariivivens TaxID=2304626 RepID=A0A5S3N5L7_9FLAO|nr:alpha-L-rhamnosidase [Polaribacter aestuariivivens]TMM30625.1 alpha-L-rhamnosidase [Polaribacter aestuariivivens]
MHKSFKKKSNLLYLFVFFTISIFGNNVHTATPLEIHQLRVEYLENPQGIDVTKPRFSWILKGDGFNRSQSSYQIMVASSKNRLSNPDIWNSGKIASNSTNQIEYNGDKLISGKKYFWQVKVWDENEVSSTSEIAFWSMGNLDFLDWQAQFIGHNAGYNKKDKYNELYLPPARYLRHSFNVKKKIKRATAYTTALGLYELRLNGNKVGDDYLLPGWTDYNKRLYYQTFDITDKLSQGENVVGAIIADGWYAGYIGYALLVRLDKVREFYGVNPSFMGQIKIEYEDGTSEVIASNDNTWKSNVGPILEADIIMGETYDARLEHKNWDKAGFDDSKWSKPKRYTLPNGKLMASPTTAVKNQETIKPIKITEPKPETYIFDLGKNIAGIAQLKTQGKAGTKITLRFGEILKNDGTLLTENLRKARATDTYILNGDGLETWEPKFTYHGFQFVEVTGLSEKPTLETITGKKLSSIKTDASTFVSSNPMNNTLFKNIKTTQAANFVDIPTDCPQRDERLGWTGDAQVFARSATYNADVASFFTKFSIDLDDAQRWYGAYPNFAPFPFSRPGQYSPAWMDAGIIIPYTMMQVYNDTRIVEYMYEGMQNFMQFQEKASTNYLRPGAGKNWGDWLAVNETTSHDFIASAYYGYDANLMSEMAAAIGKKEDAKKYTEDFKKIKEVFTKKYILSDGKTTEDSMSSYALALYFDLYPENLAEKGAARLAEKIKNNGYKFATGFLGTKHVMLALSKYGFHETSYKLFQQTAYPSWGYSIDNGSTSIWERWNSFTKDNSKNSDLNAAMNSFSHYAFGSVAEWMFQYAAGIDTKTFGYRKIIIKPAVSNEMEFINGSTKTINGEITSNWKIKGKYFYMTIEIPVNTTAHIHIPTDKSSKIKLNDKSLKKSRTHRVVAENNEETILEVGSGKYTIKAYLKK